MKEYHKIRWVFKFDEKTHLPIQIIDELSDINTDNNIEVINEPINIDSTDINSTDIYIDQPIRNTKYLNNRKEKFKQKYSEETS